MDLEKFDEIGRQWSSGQRISALIGGLGIKEWGELRRQLVMAGFTPPKRSKDGRIVQEFEHGGLTAVPVEELPLRDEEDPPCWKVIEVYVGQIVRELNVAVANFMEAHDRDFRNLEKLRSMDVRKTRHAAESFLVFLAERSKELECALEHTRDRLVGTCFPEDEEGCE